VGQQGEAVDQPTRRGRPFDPDLDARVYEHALQVYARSGWGGFSIDAVAAEAKVGKAAIYRRWSSKADILVDALMWLPAQTGASRLPSRNIWEDFELLVRSLIRTFGGPHGFAILRAQVEALVFRDLLGTAMDRRRRQWIDAGRDVIFAAIKRGELPEKTSTSLLMDAAHGIVISRIISTPQDRLRAWFDDPGTFPRQVTQLVLTGAHARPEPDDSSR